MPPITFLEQPAAKKCSINAPMHYGPLCMRTLGEICGRQYVGLKIDLEEHLT